MKIAKISNVNAEEVKGELFVGKVLRQQLIDAKTAKIIQAGVVFFSAGARNKWHTHTNEQLLYVVDGKGIVATENEEVVVTPGMIVFVPSGEKHWHGATEETSFTQLSIYTPGETKIVK